jgi:alpha-N-acetylglucosaminidase
MSKFTVALFLTVTFFQTLPVHADPVDAARALMQRVIPERADGFVIESLSSENGRDVFEIESVAGQIVLRGSNGVAIASALNHYFKNYCNASISLHGSQLDLPDPLPTIPQLVRVVTPFEYRYCFNYCCFSYSMAWWDWTQWERVIDWMALQGINLPLSVTGQEAVWQTVYRELGLSDEEIDAFMVGPAYLPFGWMGCMDGWGGPLPQSWIDEHRALQQKIVARERELGMRPVLQGFTGHVPVALKDHFPDATFQQLPEWCDFPGTTFVDPQDPLFQRIGHAFIDEQTRQFGTDHLYASDTFIEMSPPSSDPAFLERMGMAVYEAMSGADPEAVWLMQGWLFYNNAGFWKEPQTKALLGSAPAGRMIVLDLYCEHQPTWEITESFHGNPWIWCIIQSFGNQVSLHGGLPQIVGNLNRAMTSANRGKLLGAGCIMEGLGWNPVVYDLMSDLMWQPSNLDLEQWVTRFAARRYGIEHDRAAEAWRLLLGTVYSQPRQIGSVVWKRPRLDLNPANTPSRVPYSTEALVRACTALLEAADKLKDTPTYQYDVVHVTRQVLSNHAETLYEDLVAAYESGDAVRLETAGGRFLELMMDLDTLLGTREEFLLGRWLEDAKRWAGNPQEKRLYEWNARNQITLWGPRDSVLHDYAAKQWSGLIRGFYVPRWEQFLRDLHEALAKGTAFGAEDFQTRVSAWEDKWTHGSETYPTRPEGDPLATAERMLAKYGETS